MDMLQAMDKRDMNRRCMYKDGWSKPLSQFGDDAEDLCCELRPEPDAAPTLVLPSRSRSMEPSFKNSG